MDEEYELDPPPSALIESLRDLGYTPSTAIADLIDNSITAGASRINVEFIWEDSSVGSWVTVADNGSGLTKAELKRALTPGSSSPKDSRLPGDLGRFGLGMKTASWSMGRQMVVRSVKGGKDSIIRWDLNHVEKRKKWAAQAGPGEINLEQLKLPSRSRKGTVVHISQCDKILGEGVFDSDSARTAFYQVIDMTRTHLEMVFHRFLSPSSDINTNGKRTIEIVVNGVPCIAWDPFMSHSEYRQELPEQRFAFRGEEIIVRPYILPHKDHINPDEHKRFAGPKGWNLQQGYYIYRADRLIVDGGWFGRGAAKPEEHTKLARISIDLTQNMDKDWNLNILKSKARPPAKLRDEFGTIGKLSREHARKAYEEKGKRAIGTGSGIGKDAEPMWTGTVDKNKLVRFKINRDHELVKMLTSELTPEKKKSLNALLRNLEKTIPVSSILSLGFEDESQLAHGNLDEEKISDDAKLLFHALTSAGYTYQEAVEKLNSSQPFNNHPGIINALFPKKDDGNDL